MCILESYVEVNPESRLLTNLPQYLSDSLTVYQGRFLVPKLFTRRNNNCQSFVFDVKFVLNKLGLSIDMRELTLITSSYMALTNLCPVALQGLGLTRTKYLKICYVIACRIPKYNNHLLRTYFCQRLKDWCLNIHSLIDHYFQEYFKLNNFVEETYLKMVEEDICRKNGLKKNKIPLMSLSNVHCSYYVSQHRMSSLGAVRWFMKSAFGQLKVSLLNELRTRSTRNYMEINEFMTYDETEFEQFVDQQYNQSQKRYRDMVLNLEFEERRRKHLENEKRVKESYRKDAQERLYLKLYSEESTCTTMTGKLIEEAKKLVRSFNRNISRELLKRHHEEYEQLRRTPFNEEYYNVGLMFEHLYSKRGEMEMRLAEQLRLERAAAARKGIYEMHADVSFTFLDDLLYQYKDGVDKLPDFLRYKPFFKICDKIYPQKSRYIGYLAMEHIKGGAYVQVDRLFKNNALTRQDYVVCTMLQRLCRKTVKSKGYRVFNKRSELARLHNVIKTDKTMSAQLSGYTLRSYQVVAKRIIEEYRNSGVYLETRKILQKETYDLNERKEAMIEIFHGTVEERIRYLEQYDVDEAFKAAINSYNNVLRYKMPKDEFAEQWRIIRSFIVEESKVLPFTESASEAKIYSYEAFAFQRSTSIIKTLFYKNIITSMIKFMKTYSATQSQNILENRINSKPLRHCIRLLNLRFRGLWDLIELGKIIAKEEVDSYISQERCSRSTDGLFEGFFKEGEIPNLGQAVMRLQTLRERRVRAEARISEQGVEPEFKMVFKFCVASAFAVTKYIFHEKEIDFIMKRGQWLRRTTLVFKKREKIITPWIDRRLTIQMSNMFCTSLLGVSQLPKHTLTEQFKFTVALKFDVAWFIYKARDTSEFIRAKHKYSIRDFKIKSMSPQEKEEKMKQLSQSSYSYSEILKCLRSFD